MKFFPVLRKVIKATGVIRVLLVFVAFFMIGALIIQMTEPHIKSYGDACWYCYSLVSTCGFGDVVVYSAAARIVSGILSCYAVVVIAMLVGVVVNLYNKLIEMRMRGSLMEVVDKLEHLPDLSKEELEEISERVRKLV